VRRSGQSAADLVVVGAGVAGLWVALKAARAGLSVIVVEKDRPGAGASGGFLGALMPHMPERWDVKKEFQFRALVDLPAEVARLEDETGISVGYARAGRLMPLSDPRQRRTADIRADAARESWRGAFAFSVPAAVPGEWLDSARAPEGVVHETLSARLSPSHLVAALVSALEQIPNAAFLAGEALPGIDPAAGSVTLRDGTRLGFGHLVIANGVGAFPLIGGVLGRPAGTLGAAVKGQAALFDARLSPERARALPLLFEDGVYVIAHDTGEVAVGSTSETDFADPASTDVRLDEVIARARALCPVIREAPVLRRWAGLRPKAVGRDPLIGPLDPGGRVHAVAGGFKITFGIAHRMADAVLAGFGAGPPVAVPPSFAPAAHLAFAEEGARRRARADDGD
jgi:Glycine/D-amino acid oxidases (deaminating)